MSMNASLFCTLYSISMGTIEERSSWTVQQYQYSILLYLRFSIKSFQIYFFSINRYQGQKYHANLPLVYQWKYFFKRKSLQKRISSNHRTTSLEKWNVWKKCKTSIIFCTICQRLAMFRIEKNEIRLICELSAGYRLGYRKMESMHGFELWFVSFEWNLKKKVLKKIVDGMKQAYFVYAIVETFLAHHQMAFQIFDSIRKLVSFYSFHREPLRLLNDILLWFSAKLNEKTCR